MSLFDRFREAVFKLIMLSALSKASHQERKHSGNAQRPSSYTSTYNYNTNPYEPHHSEAVADCIEFIKKSATADDNRSSTASMSTIMDDPGEVIRALPVM
ncbi:hypothetical protein ACH5RR_011863 [Cinchona calisaya]|uniref:Josephin-like protein n=1 Tax=Cinchona calisaya TaxID=153742 RepID=A0ABD3A9Q9_9GENT